MFSNVRCKVVRSNGREAKNLRPNKNYQVVTKSVRIVTEGYVFRDTYLEIILELQEGHND